MLHGGPVPLELTEPVPSGFEGPPIVAALQFEHV